MERVTEILVVKSLEQIPALEVIRAIPRSKKLILSFEGAIQEQRQEIGDSLRKELDEFQVGIHMNEPEINIGKIITDKEVADNQLFFEKCAKDYRALAVRLMADLRKKLDIEFDKYFPGRTLNPLKRDRAKGQGIIGEWRYYLHGFDCGFENVIADSRTV